MEGGKKEIITVEENLSIATNSKSREPSLFLVLYCWMLRAAAAAIKRQNQGRSRVGRKIVAGTTKEPRLCARVYKRIIGVCGVSLLIYSAIFLQSYKWFWLNLDFREAHPNPAKYRVKTNSWEIIITNSYKKVHCCVHTECTTNRKEARKEKIK